MARERDSVGKLVRDKIPDMIRASGRTPHVRTLSTAEYQTALLDKLREEVAELIAAATRDAVIEEAADVLEVLPAIAAEHRADTIVGVTRSKLAERGGFDMRLSLDAIDSASR